MRVRSTHCEILQLPLLLIIPRCTCALTIYSQISGTTAVDYNCVGCEWREKVSAFSFFVFELCVTLTMKIEEAILYCLASQNRGMRTEQIAEMINRQRLHIRKDGQPVTSNQVYAVICRYPHMFVKTEGRIMLMI